MIIIEPDNLWVPQLGIRFKVIKVEWESCAESKWTIQYRDYEPFVIYEQLLTIEADEQLVGQEIEAMIEIDVEEFLPTKKEKSFTPKEFYISGIYDDAITTTIRGNTYINYKLDSIFPLKIDEIPEGAKIGDWVTLKGFPVLRLPRMDDKASWRNI
jgi:hypothetical protein